jgi:serine protease Do
MKLTFLWSAARRQAMLWRAAAFFACAALTTAAASTDKAATLNGEAEVALPKPVPAKRKALPIAFTRAAPASLADLKLMEQHLKMLVPKVSRAVVAVEVGDAAGSGVVISQEGLVLTAGHVCGRSDRNVRFTFPDGKTARGKTLGLDRDSDTGLMRITDKGPWAYVPIGELDQAQIGDWVLALGHPGGFDAKRSLVVRLGRVIRLAQGVLQTDCTISPGDSGGPLVDMHGRVIGIHSAISESLADNFHIPINQFVDGWTGLARVTPPEGTVPVSVSVGATLADDSGGCKVSKVEEEGPAYQAGLRAGDIICKVEGRDIKVSAVFRRWLAEARPGEVLSLEVRRGSRVIPLEWKVAKPSKEK